MQFYADIAIFDYRYKAELTILISENNSVNASVISALLNTCNFKSVAIIHWDVQKFSVDCLGVQQYIVF